MTQASHNLDGEDWGASVVPPPQPSIASSPNMPLTAAPLGLPTRVRILRSPESALKDDINHTPAPGAPLTGAQLPYFVTLCMPSVPRVTDGASAGYLTRVLREYRDQAALIDAGLPFRIVVMNGHEGACLAHSHTLAYPRHTQTHTHSLRHPPHQIHTHTVTLALSARAVCVVCFPFRRARGVGGDEEGTGRQSCVSLHRPAAPG